MVAQGIRTSLLCFGETWGLYAGAAHSAMSLALDLYEEVGGDTAQWKREYTCALRKEGPHGCRNDECSNDGCRKGGVVECPDEAQHLAIVVCALVGAIGPGASRNDLRYVRTALCASNTSTPKSAVCGAPCTTPGTTCREKLPFGEPPSYTAAIAFILKSPMVRTHQRLKFLQHTGPRTTQMSLRRHML